MHKFRKIGRRLLAAALAASMIFSIEAFATESEIKKQQAQTQKQLDAINQEMKSIESQRDSVLAEIDSLNSDLVNLMLNIELLESDLAAKEEELAQAQTDYEAAKQREEEQYEAMKLRIQYIYEEGDMDYLTLFLEADSFADFLNRADFAKEIQTKDRQMLEEYQETKAEVEELLDQLEQEKADMEALEAEYEEEQANVEASLEQKKAEESDYETQLANAQAQASTFRKQLEKQQKELKRLEAERIAKEKAAQETAEVGSGSSSSGSSGKKPSGGSSAFRRLVRQFRLRHFGVRGQLHRRGDCQLRAAVCGESLCIWWDKPDEWRGLFGLYHVRVRSFWHFPSAQLRRPAFRWTCGKLFRGAGGRPDLL